MTRQCHNTGDTMQDTTRQDKAIQDKTRQSNPIHDNIRQCNERQYNPI